MSKVVVSDITYDPMTWQCTTSSNLDHIVVGVFSFTTSLNTLSSKHKIMTLCTLSIIFVFSSFVKAIDINTSPFKIHYTLQLNQDCFHLHFLQPRIVSGKFLAISFSTHDTHLKDLFSSHRWGHLL